MELYEALKEGMDDGKKLASIAAGMVNSCTRQTERLQEILNDADTRDEFRKMSVAYVKSLATAKKLGFYDGRNEYACTVAASLAQYPGFEGIAGITAWDGSLRYMVSSIAAWERTHKGACDTAGAFAYYMSNEHRTLQQSFAELAFICIEGMFTENGDRCFTTYMEGQGYGRDWSRTPLI